VAGLYSKAKREVSRTFHFEVHLTEDQQGIFRKAADFRCRLPFVEQDRRIQLI
jgi:hypothetical protein